VTISPAGYQRAICQIRANGERLTEFSRTDIESCLKLLHEPRGLRTNALLKSRLVRRAQAALGLADSSSTLPFVLATVIEKLISDSYADLQTEESPRSVDWGILYLRYVMTLSMADTARRLNISLRTASRHHEQALDRLHKTLVAIELENAQSSDWPE
jgi:sigma-70-like protein